MVKKVIKKSGKKEVFDLRKIKRCIGKVCGEVHIPRKKQVQVEERVLKEVIDIAEKRAITTSEIRDIILRDLHALDPAVARAWIAFEIMKIQRKKEF